MKKTFIGIVVILGFLAVYLQSAEKVAERAKEKVSERVAEKVVKKTEKKDAVKTIILGKEGNLRVPSSDGLPLGDIKVFQVKGTVTWLNAEGTEMGELKRGHVIQEKTWIHSGEVSSALLMFSNGSTINVGEKSKVEIQVYAQEPYDSKKGMYLTLKEDPSLSRCHMFLHGGELIGTVQKLREDSTYQIETPLGTAGIRGTTYYVGFAKNEANGNYLMQCSNFDGKVLIDTPLDADLVMSDGSVASGVFNPYSGPKVYDLPQKTLVLIEADSSLLDLPDLTEVPVVTTFSEFFDQGNIKELLANPIAPIKPDWIDGGDTVTQAITTTE